MADRALNVWLNGQLAGTWSWTRTDVHRFEYADTWLESPGVRPLSLSLPIPAGGAPLRGPMVKNYFDNLLPDSDRIRQRLRMRFRLPGDSVQDLLGAIGRDCIGAVQLLPDDTSPEGYDRVECTPLKEADIERHLLAVTNDAAFGQDGEDADDFRISIAGAQEKTAFLRHRGRWCRPHGATPTTHIFKLPLGLVGNMRADMSTSVENEWLCLRIMAALGFDVLRADIAIFGEQKVLVVERFDRRWVADNTWIARLPQEDFCQATGTAPASKFESDGGPGIAACLGILAGSTESARDRLAFALAQLAFWLLAATDGHAKNFSIFLLPGTQYRLTPMYDILSAWPIIGGGASQVRPQKAKLAMALRSKNAHYGPTDIQVRHWRILAQQSGVPGAFAVMRQLVEHVPDALAIVENELPDAFPERVWTRIRDGMLQHRQRFLTGFNSTAEE
jgi:serine/threonine-protein kinase HipA